MQQPKLHLSFVYEEKRNRFVAHVSADLFNEWDNKANEHAYLRTPAEMANDLGGPRVLLHQLHELLVIVDYLRDFEEPPIMDFYAIWG